MKLLSFLLALFMPLCALGEIEDQSMRRQALYGFLDSAFGAEYNSTTRNLVRWDEPILIRVATGGTKTDMKTLQYAIQALRENVPNLPEIRLTDSVKESNFVFHFVPEGKLSDYVSGYVEGVGFVSWWYEDYRIYSAETAIASDVPQEERNHIILEELINGLGLGNDIDVKWDTVISSDWTGLTAITERDFIMLNYVYSDLINPGMTAPQAYAALYDTLWE